MDPAALFDLTALFTSMLFPCYTNFIILHEKFNCINTRKLSEFNYTLYIVLRHVYVFSHMYKYFLFSATPENLSFAFNKMRSRGGDSYIRDVVCEINSSATLYSQENEIMKNQLQRK